MAKTRTCMICGAKYEYCNHCNYDEPSWKFLYHDENCKEIGKIWYAYRGNEISKADAKKAMSAFKPNIDAALKYDGTTAAKEIRELFNSKSKKSEDIKVEDHHDISNENKKSLDHDDNKETKASEK